jgi:hypothetical protein
VRPSAIPVLITLATAIACGDRQPSEPQADRRPPDLSTAVIGAAAANLKDGEFQLASTPPVTTIPQITAAQAEAIALAWRAPFGTPRREYLTREHGAPVEPEQLSTCGRTFYAASAFDPPAPSVASDPMQLATARAFGPWWIVPLCAADGTPAVALAISAYAADLTIEHGSLVLPTRGGNWFLAQGVPPGTTRWPVTPEDAAARAAGSSGRRVTEVPMLIAPPFVKGRPQDARWLLNLDGPAIGTAFDAVMRIYAWQPTGTGAVHLGVAAASQPDQLTGYYMAHPPTPGRTPTREDFAPLTFHRRTDIALDVTDVPLTGSPSPLGGHP